MKLYPFHKKKSVMGLGSLRHNHMLKECLRVVNIRSDLLNADIKIDGKSEAPRPQVGASDTCLDNLLPLDGGGLRWG